MSNENYVKNVIAESLRVSLLCKSEKSEPVSKNESESSLR